jgi:hypothetical protein
MYCNCSPAIKKKVKLIKMLLLGIIHDEPPDRLIDMMK